MRKKICLVVLPLFALFSPNSHAWWLLNYKYWANTLVNLLFILSGYNAQFLSEESKVAFKDYPEVIMSTDDKFASIRANKAEYEHITQYKKTGTLDDQDVTLCFRHMPCINPSELEFVTQDSYSTFPGLDCDLPENFFTFTEYPHMPIYKGIMGLSDSSTDICPTSCSSPDKLQQTCYRVPYGISRKYVKHHNKALKQRKKQGKQMTHYMAVDKGTYEKIHYERIMRGKAGIEGFPCHNNDYQAVEAYREKLKIQHSKKVLTIHTHHQGM